MTSKEIPIFVRCHINIPYQYSRLNHWYKVAGWTLFAKKKLKYPVCRNTYNNITCIFSFLLHVTFQSLFFSRYDRIEISILNRCLDLYSIPKFQFYIQNELIEFEEFISRFAIIHRTLLHWTYYSMHWHWLWHSLEYFLYLRCGRHCRMVLESSCFLKKA